MKMYLKVLRSDYSTAAGVISYHCGPPPMLVLWWISFQVMTLLRPVVADRPIVKMSLLSKAFMSSFRTFSPSLQAGRKAVREVLLYLIPGFGCSGCRIVNNSTHVHDRKLQCVEQQPWPISILWDLWEGSLYNPVYVFIISTLWTDFFLFYNHITAMFYCVHAGT